MAKRLVTVCLLCVACVAHADHVVEPLNKEHIHEPENLDSTDLYHIKKIFAAFGDGETITIEGFLRLMNVGKLQHTLNATDGSLRKEIVKNGTTSVVSEIKNLHDAEVNNCVKDADLLAVYSAGTSNYSITTDTFHNFCPILLYSFVARSDYEHQKSCVYVPPVISTTEYTTHEVSLEVWFCALASVIFVSLCGLLGVVVIPFMDHIFYHQMLQFLVALAIGTLCGDALLHLLPHSIAGENHDVEHGHNHEDIIWKGFVAVTGIIFFFFTEKFLTMIAEYRKRRQKKREVPPTVRVMHDCDGVQAPSVGEKLCKHKYSSSPYCYDEITEMSEAHNKNQKSEHMFKKNRDLNLNQNSHSNPYGEDDDYDDDDDDDDDDDEDGEQIKNPGINADTSHPSTSRNYTETANGEGHICAAHALKEDENYIVIIREHRNTHHGHSHTHGHVHSPPKTMSSVAWMVVMGDGLHNFTDGVAIGAAFAANIGGGFSTAIAVFCHELPHELGDFAVLLKAGMSPKQAVFYNLLSSVLCLFGMIIGLLLGQNGEATPWVFALAGGLFLYIGLVDMIPELTSSHSKEGGSLCQCFLQFLGLFVGVGIMLVIALYEHNIKTVFTST